jgi:hypothetical protein
MEVLTKCNARYDLQTLQPDHLLFTERSRCKAVVMRLPILPGSILVKCQADDRFQHTQGNNEFLLRRVAHDLVLQGPQDVYLLGIIPRIADLCYPGQSCHFKEGVDEGGASKMLKPCGDVNVACGRGTILIRDVERTGRITLRMSHKY